VERTIHRQGGVDAAGGRVRHGVPAARRECGLSRGRAGLVVLAALSVAPPLPAWAAAAGGPHPAMWLVWIPAFVALGLGLHALGARAAKAVVAAAQPLASGEPEIAGYDRRVHFTGEREPLAVVAVAALGGAVMGVGAGSATGWGWVLGLAGVAAAVALDLLWWQRVAVSGESVWVQRGLRGEVQQVAIENVREVEVTEATAPLPSPRQGRSAQIASLRLHLRDGTQLDLPATDAASGLDAVEEAANRIRARQVHLGSRDALGRAEADATRNAAQAAAVSDPRSLQAQEREALRRLRQKALAADVPKAVKLTPPPD
jgi:hypothetical protein